MCGLGFYSYNITLKIANANSVKRNATFNTMILCGILMSILMTVVKIISIIIFIFRYSSSWATCAYEYMSYDFFMKLFTYIMPDNFPASTNVLVLQMILSLITNFLAFFFCYIFGLSFSALLNCFTNYGKMIVGGSYLIIIVLFIQLVNNDKIENQILELEYSQHQFLIATLILIGISLSIIICTILTYIGLKKAPLKLSKGA